MLPGETLLPGLMLAALLVLCGNVSARSTRRSESTQVRIDSVRIDSPCCDVEPRPKSVVVMDAEVCLV